jgi:hypothetical protein
LTSPEVKFSLGYPQVGTGGPDEARTEYFQESLRIWSEHHTSKVVEEGFGKGKMKKSGELLWMISKKLRKSNKKCFHSKKEIVFPNPSGWSNLSVSNYPLESVRDWIQDQSAF